MAFNNSKSSLTLNEVIQFHLLLLLLLAQWAKLNYFHRIHLSPLHAHYHHHHYHYQNYQISNLSSLTKFPLFPTLSFIFIINHYPHVLLSFRFVCLVCLISFLPAVVNVLMPWQRCAPKPHLNRKSHSLLSKPEDSRF